MRRPLAPLPLVGLALALAAGLALLLALLLAPRSRPQTAAPPPTPTPAATMTAADALATRDAPPASLRGSPVRQAAARATSAAHELAGLQQPGESYADYLRRIGRRTECEQTTGQVIRAADGREIQLGPGECVHSVIIGGGPGGLVIRGPDGRLGRLQPDGTVRYLDGWNDIPMATPTDAEAEGRRRRVQAEAQQALADLARGLEAERVALPPPP